MQCPNPMHYLKEAKFHRIQTIFEEAATISSCVISSSISFADPPQKDAAVQSNDTGMESIDWIQRSPEASSDDSRKTNAARCLERIEEHTTT
ncbi:hypothetical protein Tco_0374786 [Tanacetum coccineum]